MLQEFCMLVGGLFRGVEILVQVYLQGKVLSSCNKMSVSTRGELAVFVLLCLLAVSGMAVLWG